MKAELSISDPIKIDAAVTSLKDAAAAKKCWHCGCLHSSVRAIEDTFAFPDRPAALEEALRQARSRLQDVRYDCLGCEVCFPALAINVLGVEGDACPTEPVEHREGWPPLPGAYKVLRYHAPVAICALTDERLREALLASVGPEVAIVGNMQTENLGIERLIQNALANPNIRFLILCGADSRQAVGHLPGRTLLALAHSGVDASGRIIGAPGKRAILHNLSQEAVQHFRQTVEVVDFIGTTDTTPILRAAKDCSARYCGPASTFEQARTVPTTTGYLPQRAVADPAGYFVIFADHKRQLLTLEHYQNDGVLDAIIEGVTAAEVCTPAIEKGLLSRLDHAVYLGKELTRAQHSLATGKPYVQDAASEGRKQEIPDLSVPGMLGVIRKDKGCGCGSSCGEKDNL